MNKKIMTVVLLTATLVLFLSSGTEAALNDLEGREIGLVCTGVPRGSVELRERIAEVEARYNFDFKINRVSLENQVEEIIAALEEGRQDYSIVQLLSSYSFELLVEDQILHPLDEYIGDYYQQLPPQLQPVEDAAVIEGLTYAVPTVGADYSGYPFSNGFVVFWNREMFAEHNLPCLYELQEYDNWTWEMMMELARELTADTTGDGEIDRFGLGGYIGYPSFNIYLMSTFGAPIMEIDRQGDPVFTLDDPRTVDAFEQLYRLFNEEPAVATYEDIGSLTSAYLRGDLAMLIYPLHHLENIYEDTGLAYLPRGDYRQDYVVPVLQVELAGVPITEPDPGVVVQIHDEIFAMENVEQVVASRARDIAPDEESLELYKEMSASWEIDPMMRVLSEVVGRDVDEEAAERFNTVEQELDNFMESLMFAEIRFEDVEGYLTDLNTRLNQALAAALE